MTPTRRRLIALAASGVAATAGCGGRSNETATVAPQLRGTPETVYRGSGAALARPRRLIVRNRVLRSVEGRIRLRDGATTLVDRLLQLGPAARRNVGPVIATADSLSVALDAGGGQSLRTEWTATPDGGDLLVEIDDGVTVRDRYAGGRAASLVTTGAVGDGPRVVIDNPGSPRTVGVRLVGRDTQRLGLSVPERSRVAVPVSVNAPKIAARLSVGSPSADRATDAEESVEETTTTPAGTTTATPTTETDSVTRDGKAWQPVVDEPLDVTLDPGRFVCDRYWRDVLIDNSSGDLRTVELGFVGDGEQVLDRTVSVPDGGTRRLRASLPPAGAYVSDVVAGDLTERYAWGVCPPLGNVTVEITPADVTVGVTPLERS